MTITIPVNDQTVQLESNRVTGADIKRAAGIDSARHLTQWNPGGVRLVDDDESVEVTPDSYFEDVPNFIYG